MLVLPQECLDQMKAHGQAGYPHEVCGLLVGVSEPGGVHRIHSTPPCQNLNTERAKDRYDLDPKDYMRIENEASDAGHAIIGVYHTHPDCPCIPSETDRSRAEGIFGNSESWSYLILEVSGGEAVAWRSWILRNAQFDEEDIQVGPASALEGGSPKEAM